jgi:hypothetical protein
MFSDRSINMTDRRSLFAKSWGARSLLWISVAVVTALGYAIAAMTRGDGNDLVHAYTQLPDFMRLGVPLLIVSGLLGPLLRQILSTHDHKSQKVRDDLASTIWDELQQGKHPRYAVYLRSFWQEGKSTVDGNFEYGSFGWFDSPKRDFEYFLASALQDDTPVIGLGRNGPTVGLGQIQTDDATWQAKVKQLCLHATAIYISPLHTEGTRWEARMLRDEGLLRKTVFIMPPQDGISWKQSELAKKWNAARDSYQAEGFEIPKYWELGLLFSLNDHGGLEASDDRATLLVDSPRKLRKQITNFLQQRERRQAAAVDSPGVAPGA